MDQEDMMKGSSSQTTFPSKDKASPMKYIWIFPKCPSMCVHLYSSTSDERAFSFICIFFSTLYLCLLLFFFSLSPPRVSAMFKGVIDRERERKEEEDDEWVIENEG
ncbi:hypothetical protein PIB30_070985 [Stylosanthes scabra]|uniref:Transmembrane protein n=1 Tax=Stylosanthes scabra TaxID=79078 RepID=A0ABU6VPK2_9FABA|nr:hypothetical protein [Stylosanthes scabra]